MQKSLILKYSQDPDDAALVERLRRRDSAAFRTIMQRNNRRLYRIARSVLGDENDAEDVVQEAYMRAFTHLNEFRGDARLSTWLTRIVVNEALSRKRQHRTMLELKTIDAITDQGESRVIFLPTTREDVDPEARAARTQVRCLLEQAVDHLPHAFRVVFVLRDIEEMSVEETAAHLGLRPETVKTRLHRARRLLRRSLERTLAPVLVDTFPFAGARCERIITAVLERLGLSDEPNPA